MPIVRRRRIARKRKAGKGRRGMRSMRRTLNANKQDRATVVEVQELTAVPEGGNFIGHQLSQYNRAMSVAKGYRYFRCKKVELEFIPFANVFAPGTAFPEVYFQVDRTQGVIAPGATLPLPTKNIMLARGVMPQKWTSIIKKQYAPSVARLENLYQNIDNTSNVIDVIGLTTTPVFNKWYATQQFYSPPAPSAANAVGGNYAPQSLRYFGAAYFVDQPLAAPGAVLGTIKMRVHWEFKEPLWLTDSA